ncbi:hypothetical protein KSP40_PGU017782 [Platanthera guangdongensis]|uniref:Uncharacterized protein n=1 Tax=Platanthera guangdongensis TaxID=2320717 RepID=A0ABR2LZG4_9ASPA
MTIRVFQIKKRNSSVRAWFRKFQQREGKVKPVVAKQKEMESVKDVQKPPIDEAPLSDITRGIEGFEMTEVSENGCKCGSNCTYDSRTCK